MEDSQSNSPLNTDQLAELIQIKRRILEQIRELTRRQPEIIEQSDLTQLMNILSVKGRLMNELQRTERLLDPFRSQDPDKRAWRTQADRDACREESKTCDLLLKEIMLVEKQCETELSNHRDQIQHRLHAAHDASQANQAYASSAPARRSLDICSDR